jgi:O-glycosyl hydrolase
MPAAGNLNQTAQETQNMLVRATIKLKAARRVMPGFPVFLLSLFFLMQTLTACAQNQQSAADKSHSVLAPEALLTTPVGGMERTQATSAIVPVQGQTFRQAVRVQIGQKSADTNATQLTMLNATPIEKGDALFATFWVRGVAAGGNAPAQIEFMFEKATDPWTKSVTRGVVAARGNVWKRAIVPFTAAENYAPQEAMASLRLAFGPQTVEIGGLEVVNYGKTKTAEELIATAAAMNPLGTTSVVVRPGETKQTMRGFGGNFAQPRYGATEPMDAVGQFNLDNLRVVHARIGIPLNYWTPERGVYKDEAQAHAALLQMQMMAQRKIPITGSVWEGPLWMLGEPAEKPRTLPRERYDDCIEAIARFLVTARDKYGAHADYFSFNEPDYGVNFKFTPQQMAEFIRLAGPRFAALGLKTKFLTADTANGSNFAAYARPLLEDPAVAPFLGPLAFHSWDVLSASEAKYREIAALGRQFNKPVWCTEAGHDAQLWQASNPWENWENGLRTALAYERTIRLTGAEQMDYWTYQDNYPLVSRDGKKAFPVWHVIRQMEAALPAGAKITGNTSSHDELKVLTASGPARGQFSVLLVNAIGAGQVNLSGLPPRAAFSLIGSTSEAQGRVMAQNLRTDSHGRVTVNVPARSVITLVSARAAGVR